MFNQEDDSQQHSESGVVMRIERREPAIAKPLLPFCHRINDATYREKPVESNIS